VVDVNFFSAFDDQNYLNAFKEVSKENDAAVQKFMAERKTEGKPVTYMDVERINRQYMAKIPRPPLKSLIDQIDHIAKVAGIDHVGLGSDFDGVSGATPQGIGSAADLPKITQALLDRGYSAEDIKKVLGGNVLRVFAQVEQVSRKMQSEKAQSVAH
jgi:membrane dipeptidase